MIYLFLCVLVGVTFNQEALVDDLSPKINFINVQAGSPTITLTFKSPTLEFESPLTDFWLKLEVPFKTSSLGPPSWGETTSCCNFVTMAFKPTLESHAGYSGEVSTIYVQLLGSQFAKDKTFVLQLVPREWISRVGYTEYLKLSIVSDSHASAITYAYNNAFTNFYASPVATNNLIVADDTVDPNRLKVNKVIDSYLIVQMGYSTAQRIIIYSKGDYKFADDSNTLCGLVADAAKGIAAVDSSTYKCEFWDNLGPSKQNYMVFTWTKGYIPSGKYKLKFRLKTPASSGNNHLTIYTLARYYPFIFVKKDYDFIFAAVNDGWETGYPKLYFASNFDANNDKFIDAIGLYSMGLNYHKTFNSLRFVLRGNTVVSALGTGESYTLKIFVGDTKAILPLGYVYENLPLAAGFASKNITYSAGVLTIANIGFQINTAYTVSFRVGFLTEQSLPTDNYKGFGLCTLAKGATTLLTGKALMRSRFNNVKFNPSLMTVESVDRGDNFKRRHKGFSAFRSELVTSLNTISDYSVTTARNGLRTSTSQQTLFFQSSIGPNPLYYIGDLVSTHNGKRMFLDVITDKSITGTGVVNTDCDVYARIYSGNLASDVSAANCQLAVNKQGAPIPTIASFPSGRNFINGCQVKEALAGSDSYTRLRMHFKDVQFVDTNAVKGNVRAKDIVLIDKDEVKTTNGAQGNIYYWKNIKVNKYPTFKFLNTDAVVLDAYVLLYLFAGTETTEDNIEFPPEITSMDNMYVLAPDETYFPISTNIYATIQHTWILDSNADPAKWDITTHDSNQWPVVLHFFGEFNVLPSMTRYVFIFFDFLDVLLTDEQTNAVACSIKGITVSKCSFGLGHNVLTEQIYRTIENNAGYSYITSRLNSYLQLELTDAQAANFNKKFSLVIPVKMFTGQELNKLVTLYENQVSLGTAFMALDSTFKILDYIDFGTGSKTLKIDTKVFNTNYEIASKIETLELLSSAIRGLDDTTANNNVNNAFWIEPIPGNSFSIGSVMDGKLKSVCTACNPYSLVNQELFSSGLICGNWDLGSDINFLVDYNAADDMLKSHKIQYKTKEGLLRTCLYVPSILKSTSILDAQVKVYDLKKLFVPNYAGIKWPADMVAILSNSKVLGYMKPQSLNNEHLPNQIVFGTGDDSITFIQNYNSAKVTLNFGLTNPLPTGAVLFFGVTAGCEALLTIYGEVGTPPCQIRNNLVKGDGSGKAMACIYSINTGGFQIELQEPLAINGDLTTNNVEVVIYGLSVKKPSQSTTCNFQLRSYLTLAKNPLLMTDKSTNFLAATYSLAADPAQPSGKLQIVSTASDNYQVTAYSNVVYRLLVVDRPIYQTDFVSLSLGALKYDTSDEPVWCVVKHPTSGKYLPEFRRCVSNNLGLIGIKAYRDLAFNEFSVSISNIINPIVKTPGAVAEYYINEGFVTFTSAALDWNSIVNQEKFLNPVRAWTEFDFMGLKSDIFVSFIPDHSVNTTNVIYLYLSPQYLPTLSRFKIYVSLRFQSPSGKSAGLWQEMKIWNIAPRMLAVTGWASTIPSGSNVTLRVVGIENPVSSHKRVFQVTLGYNKQYSLFKQWGYTSLAAASPISSISLISVATLTFDSIIIRENTKITIGFSFDVIVPAGGYVLAYIGYLGDEIVRKFKPFCFLTKANEFIQTAERCYFVGNRLEAKLIFPIEAATSYTFILDDIPNPDFGYVEPESISLFASTGDRQQVLALSTEMIINYKKQVFVKRDLSQILDFVGLADGTIEVPQGFYSTVTISPVVVDATKESPFFLDQVSFALGEIDNNTLVSKPLSILGIENFIGKVGTSGVDFVVGATRSTVLTTYPVQVTKREATGKVYTELGLLRVKVVPVTFSLQGTENANTYITSKSIPIKISVDKVPTQDIKFDILFLNGDVDGKVEVSARQQQFIVNEEKLAFFLQLEALASSIPPQVVKVTIRPVLASSNFNDKVVNFNLISKPPNAAPAVVTFNVGTSSAFFFSFDFKAQATSEVFIYYFAVPDYLFSEQPKDTVRAWALNGLSLITGDIYVGSLGISSLNADQKSDLTTLIADTNYVMTCYIEDPLKAEVDKKEFRFSTKSLSSKNAITTLTFTSSVSYENRIKLLCILARRYSMSYENLWSGDGLNCDPNLKPAWVKAHFDAAEKEPLSEAANKTTLSMEVIAFQSKRKGENSQGLTNLIAATALSGANNVFALFFNGVARLSTINPMGNFFETKPSLTTKFAVKEGWNTTTITNIQFTGLKGFVFGVAQSEPEFPDTLTIGELRKLDKFVSSYWQPIYESPADLSVVFNNLQPSTAYKAAIVATSDDPRNGAATSDILFVTFKTTAKPGFSQLLATGCSLLLLLITVF